MFGDYVNMSRDTVKMSYEPVNVISREYVNMSREPVSYIVY
jgi:hypothetical protein